MPNEVQILGVDVDEKGRPLPATMTDREIAVETLILMRFFCDALTAISNSPIASAMMPGFPKL